MPVLIATPFATNGTKNDIPETMGLEPQNATMDVGFPDITEQPISTGGIPPERADFNGILYALSDNISHINKGLAYSFDTTFATKIGGYPLHAELVMADGTRVVSTVQNNMNDPDVDLTGWQKGGGSVTASDVLDESGRTQQEINTAQESSVIYAESYSLSDTADNTSKYNQLINDVPNNAKIVFPYGKTLTGHFISENKSFNIDFNGCTLINNVDDKPIVQIGPLAATAYSVTETVLNHGDTQFTVVGASTLFKVGDIGYLWDGATRSTTGSVNYESIKIKSISGDVITVEGFLASYKGASAIKFYHSAAQLKNPSFSNLNLKPTATHTAITSLIANSENPSVSNIETVGTTGNAVAIRYCYGLEANNIRPLKAQAVGSGQGYGLSLLCVSNIAVSNINGSGMRHVYDHDSVYFGDIKNLSDDDDKSAPVGLAHNGFTGYITLDGVRCVTSQYPVVLSEQGYGGEVPALKANHPFRSVHVKNVNAKIRADVDPSTNTGVYGVYFQNSVIGCSVDGVDVDVLNENAMTATSGSALVRVNGVVNKGLAINNLKANKIGRVFAGTGGTRGGFAHDNSKTTIRNVSVGDVGQVYLAQGHYFMDVDGVSINNTPKSNKIGVMTVSGSDVPVGANFGANIDYIGGGVALLDCNATSAIAGSLPKGTKTAAAGITLIDGQSITINELQEKSAWGRLNPPSGTATITVTMPKPQTIGDEVNLSVPTGRNNVTLSGANMNADVTINTGQLVTLRVVGSKWSLISRSNNT